MKYSKLQKDTRADLVKAKHWSCGFWSQDIRYTMASSLWHQLSIHLTVSLSTVFPVEGA